MIHAELGAIVVTDSKLFGRTGAVGKWAEGIKISFTAHAIEKAPSSLASSRPNKSRANAAYPSGSMKLNIEGDVVRVGVRQLQTTVSVNVPYAIFVIRGTRPVILAETARIPKGEPGAGQFADLSEGGGMYLPGNPTWGSSMFRQRVRGQRANNFLGDAFDATARTHRSLKGFTMVG